mmetsp:Transcript_1363/g.3210  ORF Transcript_1363/g.3210 Transcript_1363/m.3210 type:complete len:284 (-) Transcript_1363:1044-1895(-)
MQRFQLMVSPNRSSTRSTALVTKSWKVSRVPCASSWQLRASAWLTTSWMMRKKSSDTSSARLSSSTSSRLSSSRSFTPHSRVVIMLPSPWSTSYSECCMKVMPCTCSVHDAAHTVLLKMQMPSCSRSEKPSRLTWYWSNVRDVPLQLCVTSCAMPRILVQLFQIEHSSLKARGAVWNVKSLQSIRACCLLLPSSALCVRAWMLSSTSRSSFGDLRSLAEVVCRECRAPRISPASSSSTCTPWFNPFRSAPSSSASSSCVMMYAQMRCEWLVIWLDTLPMTSHT